MSLVQTQQSNTVFNQNSVTFLNDLDNHTSGLDKSNDVINGQGGNDYLEGLSGDDVLGEVLVMTSWKVVLAWTS
jgi:hypothetical protein